MTRLLCLLLAALAPGALTAAQPWLLGKAYKLPTEYTNQESGYFSLIAGLDDKLYIGAAKYGVNAYLIEFDPKAEKSRLVMDVHEVTKLAGKGYAAQAKIHTRNNVGASGKIYVGSKQGYPEKGEHRADYPGGYVLTYDPKTGTSEHFGIAKARHGIISVVPDESRGVAYVSTCSDDRPIDHTHFMVLDLKTKTYTDLGDMEHAYAFVVIDDKGRAYHPVRGGTIARYDPETKKVTRLKITIDGKAPTGNVVTDHAILNWDTTADRKTMYSVEMTTNALVRFDLTAAGDTLPGVTVGKLVADVDGKPVKTDCRAMSVGPDGTVWAAVTVPRAGDVPVIHLVSHKPKTAGVRDHGPIAVSNKDFTTFKDGAGKDKPWHHTMPVRKDGVRAPWQPMGVCATKDGTVWVETIAPFTLIRFDAAKVK